jgi:hypothetical protein
MAVPTSNALWIWLTIEIRARYGMITPERRLGGDYRLVKENRAANASELKFLGAAGDSIYLQNGLVLTHQ